MQHAVADSSLEKISCFLTKRRTEFRKKKFSDKRFGGKQQEKGRKNHEGSDSSRCSTRLLRYGFCLPFVASLTAAVTTYQQINVEQSQEAAIENRLNMEIGSRMAEGLWL